MNLKECIALIDGQEILDFASELIRVPSIPPKFNEREVAVKIQNKLKEYGIDSELDDVGPNRANIVASIGNDICRHLLISGHLDVVPPISDEWEQDPFEPVVKDGILYGRGSADMKGGDACLIMAMCYLKKCGADIPGIITYLGTCGEEDDLCGTEDFRRRRGLDDVDGVIIAEATKETLYAVQKGCLWIDFVSYGRAAHSGCREAGVNALENMLAFLEKFRRYEFPVKEHPLAGKPSININKIEAGEVFNTLPEICRCKVDVRTVPGNYNQDVVDYAQKVITELTEEIPGFHVECNVFSSDDVVDTPADDPVCLAVLNAGEKVLGRRPAVGVTFYGTDGYRMIKTDGTRPPIAVYGPGDPIWNHKANEHLKVRTLTESTEIYIRAIWDYLKIQ